MANVEKAKKETIDVLTPEKKRLLQSSFSGYFRIILQGAEYHSRRAGFFKRSNFIIKSIDAVVGIGALVVIGNQNIAEIFTSENILFSLSVAGLAVFLLYFGVLCDFSKKEETHRWILASYYNLNKKVSVSNLIDWGSLTSEEYYECRFVHDQLEIDLDCLRKEEQPMLKFLEYLADLEVIQRNFEKPMLIFDKISRFRFFLADYFSMPNYTMKMKNLEFAMKEEERTKKDKSGIHKGSAEKV